MPKHFLDSFVLFSVIITEGLDVALEIIDLNGNVAGGDVLKVVDFASCGIDSFRQRSRGASNVTHCIKESIYVWFSHR